MSLHRPRFFRPAPRPRRVAAAAAEMGGPRTRLYDMSKETHYLDASQKCVHGLDISGNA